ncbi:MAG: tetratricopeptide repeat protein [Candidatus Sericytochromatia bacterium]
MKKLLLTTGLFFLLTFPAFAEKRMAVLPFDVPNDKTELKQFGTGTSDTITMALSSIKDFIMIDRSRTESILKEQAFQNSGFVDQENAVKLGKLVGAEILVVGSIQYIDGIYRITSRLTEVETSKVIKSVQVTGNNIFELQDKIALEIIKANNIALPNDNKNENGANSVGFEIAKTPSSPSIYERIKSIFKSTSSTVAYNYYNLAKNSFLNGKEKDLKNAIYYYNKALDEDPKYALALAGKAQALAYIASDYEISGKSYKEFLDKALENANKAIELNLQTPEPYKVLSLINKMQGKFDEGRNYAQKALELSPNDAEAYYLLWANEPNPRYDDQAIKKAVDINPFIIKRTTSIAYTYFKQSKFTEAINIYNQAINLYPTYNFSYIGLGFTYYYVNDFKNAENSFKKSLEIKEDGAAYSGLGLIAFKLGDIQKAEILIKKGIKLSPENSINYTSLGFLYYYTGKKDEAVKYFSKALELNSEDFYARDAIGLYYFEKGDINKALEHYNASLSINPLGVAANYNIGNVYRYWGKNDEAIAKFNECLKIFPYFTPALEKLAEIYDIKREYNYSAVYYQKLSEFSPSNEYFNKTAFAFHQLNKYDEAEKYYKKSLEINPNDLFTLNNLGIIYYSKNNLDMAIEQYNKVLELNPNDINATENIALTFNKKGDKNKANFYYKKACILGSNASCEILETKLHN